MEPVIQARLQAVVVAIAACIRVFDETEIRIRHGSSYAVHDERLVIVDQMIEVGGLGSHVIRFRSPRITEFALHPNTPLLNLGAWTMRIHCTHMVRLQLIQVDIGWIEISGRESLRRRQHRLSVAGRCTVDKEWWVECHLVFAAVTFEERVVDTISTAQHCLLIRRVGDAEPWTKVLCVRLNQGAILQGATRCEGERAVSGRIEVRHLVVTGERGRREIVA